MSYETLDIKDIDWNKMNLKDSLVFEEQLTEHLNNIEVYDPEVGTIFPVDSLDIINNKICALLPNDVVVLMNLSTEYRCLKDILFEDNNFKNRKEFLSYLKENKKEINDKVRSIHLKIEITNTKNGILEGSINLWNSKLLTSQFLDQIKYNQIIESRKKVYTKSKTFLNSYQNSYSEFDIEEAILNQRYYKCHLVEMNKGGFLGYISGLQVFIPGSLVHYKKIDNYEDFIDKTINVMIDSYVKERKIFIASNKRYIEAKIPEVIENIDNNEKLTGTITGLTKYGIFINFKEILNGLLHVSEMCQTNIDKLTNDEFTLGDSIDFFVKSYSDNKIVLSEMSLEDSEKEWKKQEDELQGTIVLARCIKKISYGFLFELQNGQKGLLYDIEARKYPMRIEIGNEYEVEVWKMDFSTSKTFLKFPDLQNLQELADEFLPK